MYAAHVRDTDIVELLVKAGASGNLRAVPSARDFVLSPPWDEAFSFLGYTHSILEEARAGDFSGPNAFMIAMAQGMSTDPIPEVCDIRAQDTQVTRAFITSFIPMPTDSCSSSLPGSRNTTATVRASRHG